MLDALTVELHQKLFNLPRALSGFFVQGDANQTVGCRQSLGGEAGLRALNVEIADLAKIEQTFVEARPKGHAAAVDVVCKVIN